MHYASIQGLIDVVSTLIEMNADINACTNVSELYDLFMG